MNAADSSTTEQVEPADPNAELQKLREQLQLLGVDIHPKTPPCIYSHVGRNQPCPCGSGKKFKNCHYTGAR